MDTTDELYTIHNNFLDAIDKSISTGDTKHIEKYLQIFGDRLDTEIIKTASSIIIQIIQEKIEDLSLINC